MIMDKTTMMNLIIRRTRLRQESSWLTRSHTQLPISLSLTVTQSLSVTTRVRMTMVLKCLVRRTQLQSSNPLSSRSKWCSNRINNKMVAALPASCSNSKPSSWNITIPTTMTKKKNSTLTSPKNSWNSNNSNNNNKRVPATNPPNLDVKSSSNNKMMMKMRVKRMRRWWSTLTN